MSPQFCVLFATRRLTARCVRKSLQFRFAHLAGVTPLAGAIVVKPQKSRDPPPLALDRAGSQSANLAGGCVLIEQLHAPRLPRKNCSVNSRARIEQCTRPNRRVPMTSQV
jgi:hypothetical protein